MCVMIIKCFSTKGRLNNVKAGTGQSHSNVYQADYTVSSSEDVLVWVEQGGRKLSVSLCSSQAHHLHSPCTGDTALLCSVSWNRYWGAASLMQPELCQLIMELWFRNTAQRARRIAFHFPRPAMVTTTSDRGPPYTSECWGGGQK